jgi:hypothetical protein
MKALAKLVVIIGVVVLGYFIYENYLVSPADEEQAPESVASTPLSVAPEIPETCRPLIKELENAIYGAATHQSSFAGRNAAYRRFQSCLQEAGFSNAEVDAAVKKVETRVQGYLKQDGG